MPWPATPNDFTPLRDNLHRVVERSAEGAMKGRFPEGVQLGVQVVLDQPPR